MYKVLIVDDSKADVDGIVKYVPWNKLNCEVVGCAFDGKEGVDKARELEPDIIITDISMPILSGIEMSKQIKKIRKNVNFVFISCFDTVEYLKSAIDIQVSSFILKPIKIDSLTAVLNNIVTKLDEEKKFDSMKFVLENQISENKKILLNRFVLDSIMSSEFDPNRASYVGVDVDKDYIMLIVIHDSRSTVTDKLVYNDMSVLKDRLDAAFERIEFLIDIDLGKLGIFLPGNMAYDEILRICDGIRKEMFLETGRSISVFARLEASYIDEFSKIYQKLNSYIVSYYSCFTNQMIIVDECKFFAELLDEQRLFDLRSELINIIDFGIPEKLNEFVDDIFKSSVISNEYYLKSICFLIINTISDILRDRNENLSNIFDNEIILRRKISNISTVVDIKMWMYNVINFVREYFEKNMSPQNKYFNMAEVLKKYIDENFEHDTVLMEAASNLGISVNYANTIFRKYKGDTMFSYLIHVRIEKAKYYLKNASFSVKEVALMTGYTTDTYFSKVFKKHVGMSPAEYKSNCKED